MHAYRPGTGQARTKLLYLFRSPSHVQIGRKPLDPEVREALEHTHPDLTFDWNGLLRDSPPPARQPRVDPSDPRERRGRGGRAQKAARPERPAAPQPPPDDSALGQALGSVEAARLRHRYAELAQRVNRRSRTPEERDRLMAELAVINPDDWTGSDFIRQRAREADRLWDAIAVQLPKRRRGRRGGREDGPDQMPAGDVIIGERDNTDERTTETDATRLDAGGDRDAERSADPAGAGPDSPAPDLRQPG